MESTSAQQRPQHRRNASSKSNIFKALVPSRARNDEILEDSSSSRRNERTQRVPLLPPGHPHAARSQPLGERQGNVQSPPSSPSKSRQKSINASTTGQDRNLQSPKKASRPAAEPTKKSKSTSNLSAMLGKMNRSSKDLSALAAKDKENTTPPSSSYGQQVNTPIWAQYATSLNKPRSRPNTSDGQHSANSIENEIAKYTPQVYSPSKQRNFDGDFEQPRLRPTLANSRPQSMYVLGTEMASAIGRRVSGDRMSISGRKSEDLERRKGGEVDRRVSGEKTSLFKRTEDRKTSGSSTEQPPAKEKITITKRGGRVMAAVAALQGKSKEQPLVEKAEPQLDPKAVDQAFEAVLVSRNVPEPMRQKMRSLTLRVKADFVKQDQEASKATGSSPIDANCPEMAKTKVANSSPMDEKTEDDSKSTKRSRARSRTFTFSKGDKRTDGSPSKRQRSSSKNRATSAHEPATPTTPRSSMDMKRRSGAPSSAPIDFITYLRGNRDPVKVEVGRLHKLRILLRNETVAWVDSFVSLGGMTEIVGLLQRIMSVEWREEHEDQLLHETLLCLKGLCTTERAMTALDKVADELFPALLAMLFDDEKKGPAEYSTRTIIVTVLFSFLASATSSPTQALEQQARRILAYLGEPTKPEDDRPVGFVLDMRVSRPYKLWCRELTHVTKEVFWIFLHHLNVVPAPKGSNSADGANDQNESTFAYTQRHFPGTRPPVPAAPYIGGVEWDATTYITAHLDLLNGLIASLPTGSDRSSLRSELRASGFEKVLGSTLRTCKEKFYSGVHDGLRAWVAAAVEDGWETRFVREGPTMEEQARSCSPKKSPKKKVEKAPQLEAPKLDLGLDIGDEKKASNEGNDDDGWLG